MLPERYKTMHTILEDKTDEIITDEDVKNAKKILEKAKQQNNRINFIEQML